MNKIFITILSIAANLLVIVNVSAAQDTTCVSTDALIKARQDIVELERQDSLNTKLLLNLREQRNKLRNISLQDSVVIAHKENIIKSKNQQLVLRDNRINRLEQEVKYSRKRRWIYYGGGIATAVLAAVIVNNY